MRRRTLTPWRRPRSFRPEAGSLTTRSADRKTDEADVCDVTARELDLLAARAWPPLEEARLGEWRLRFAGGVTKRANSVLPLGPGPAKSDAQTLDRRLTLVERAYQQRGLPPRFQVTASSWPDTLPQELRNRNYIESDLTLVLTSAIPSAHSTTPAAGERALVERNDVSDHWFDTWWAVDGRGGAAEAEIARAILDRIDAPCLFAECHEPEGIAAVALGVRDDTWIGLYCLATLPWARRRGCARAIVSNLLTSARENGARNAHLAVLEANVASRQLCATLGFERRQSYSYFTADTA
jgi:N-acetylglutamate synthase